MDFLSQFINMVWLKQLMLDTIIVTYMGFNSFRVLSYLPQIIVVWKQKSEAKAIALLTWSAWTGANLTGALYGYFIMNDSLMAIMSLGNTLGCAMVIAIVMYKRKKYGPKATSKDVILAQDQDVLDVFAK